MVAGKVGNTGFCYSDDECYSDECFNSRCSSTIRQAGKVDENARWGSNSSCFSNVRYKNTCSVDSDYFSGKVASAGYCYTNDN